MHPSSLGSLRKEIDTIGVEILWTVLLQAILRIRIEFVLSITCCFVKRCRRTKRTIGTLDTNFEVYSAVNFHKETRSFGLQISSDSDNSPSRDLLANELLLV